MTKILLTGGTGFIGKAVLEALKDEPFEIHVCTRNTVSMQTESIKSNVVYHQCSLNDYVAIGKLIEDIKPEGLIHLAWYVNPKDYINSEENYKWIEISENLFKTFIKHGGKRIFSAGTCFEYEFTDGLLDEYNSRINPISIYAQCKVRVNEILKECTRDNDVTYVWGRIGYIYGENEHAGRVVPYIIETLRKNEMVTCKNATAQRDYIYVKDLGEAIVKSFLSTYEGELNLGTGKGIQMQEIFMEIARQLNQEEKVILKDEPVSPKSLVLDVKRLENEVGYKKQTDIKAAVTNILV